MQIKSAKFIKSAVGPDEVFTDGVPQVAFIGRSNVGKSSVINALAKQDGLAKTSSFPGRTQQINIFLINKSFYLVDLPGYGFARLGGQAREKINDLINWYFFDSGYNQKKVILIVDAKVGLTKSDEIALYDLEKAGKDVVIVANKVDTLNAKTLATQLKAIQAVVGSRKVIPFSAEKGTGLNTLAAELM